MTPNFVPFPISVNKFFFVFHSDFGCLKGVVANTPHRYLTYIYNPVPNRVKPFSNFIIQTQMLVCTPVVYPLYPGIQSTWIHCTVGHRDSAPCLLELGTSIMTHCYYIYLLSVLVRTSTPTSKDIQNRDCEPTLIQYSFLVMKLIISIGRKSSSFMIKSFYLI